MSTNIDRAAEVIQKKLGVMTPSAKDTARRLADAGLLADEHHSTAELYDYRMVYNALLFNEWARAGKYDVHKSWAHSDGELCFGGGWFIVCATTPHGLVSNHYHEQYWDMFDCEHHDLPVEYDGHTPQEALSRLMDTAADHAEEADRADA